MKRNLKSLTLGALVSIVCLVGCTPDDLTVTIPATAIKRVENNEVTLVKVTTTFSVGDDEDGTLQKVKRIALPYLGEGAQMSTKKEDDETTMTATFKIPFYKESSDAGSVPKSILCLVMLPNGRIKLTDGPQLAELNEKLQDAVSDGVRFNGGHTYFRIMNNVEKPVNMLVIGAFVDKKAVAIGKVQIPEEDASVVDFKRDNESIWHTLDPFVSIDQISAAGGSAEAAKPQMTSASSTPSSANGLAPSGNDEVKAAAQCKKNRMLLKYGKNPDPDTLKCPSGGEYTLTIDVRGKKNFSCDKHK